jgi:hypothetical protein
VRRSHEQTCGNADTRSDQVPEHLLAGVNGPSSVIAGALFCYGVNNDVPGRAQNGKGPAAFIALVERSRKISAVGE